MNLLPVSRCLTIREAVEATEDRHRTFNPVWWDCNCPRQHQFLPYSVMVAQGSLKPKAVVRFHVWQPLSLDKHRVHGVVCTDLMKLLSDKVLVINKNWQAIAETTVQEAICDCCAGKATAIDMETMRAITWPEWISLPIRDGDKFIQSIRGPVRVPTVVGKFSYSKMPKRRPKLDNGGIARRDGKVCQVTGEFSPDGNVDHVIPRSRGGKAKSWSNMVWMRRDLNSKKGDKTLDEMGWKLIRTPHKPEDLEACRFIQPKHPDWEMFLPKQK